MLFQEIISDLPQRVYLLYVTILSFVMSLRYCGEF
jgi:hypothetical protein